jgi:hypothetical protein
MNIVKIRLVLAALLLIVSALGVIRHYGEARSGYAPDAEEKLSPGIRIY